MTAYAHVNLSGSRDEVMQHVRDGEVDMGIVQHAERNDDLDFQGLFVYERVLITPKDHPLLKEPLWSLDQLAPWPLILMGRGTHTRAIIEQEFTRKGLDYEILLELDSMDMIKRYVANSASLSRACGRHCSPSLPHLW